MPSQSSPRIIHQTEHCRLWHKLDDSFMTPKANVLVYITTPVDYLTPLHSVLADLLCRLVEDDLRDLSYMAEVAGLHANVDTTRSGSLYFEFSGYSQKIDMLMEAVVGHFRRFSADTSPALRDRKRWLMFAEEMQKECGNFQRSSSMAQTLVFTDYFIRPVFWLETERKSVLDRVLSSEACIKQAMEQTCQFARDLFRQFHMEMVVCGNLPAERAVQMAKRLENIAIDAAADGVGVETVQSQTSALATRADWMDNQYSLIRRSLLLPTAGCRLAHIRQQTDPSHTHSAVDYYIQIGDPADCNLRCHLFLLAQMLHEPAFHQLRTTEQLGYAVRVAQHRSAGVSGLRVIVESEWDSVYVERRIERFLRSYQQRLDGMGDEEFEKSRQAAVSLLRKKDDHWLQESYRWIRHIRSGYFEFDQVETDVCCLMEQVSLQTIREFYRNHVNPDSPRRSKLSVHVRSLQPPKNNETAFSKSEDLMGRLLALLRDKHGMDLEVADLREAIESIGLAGGAALQTIVAGEAESYKQNALPPPVANDGEPIAAEEADLERLADQLFAHLGRRRSDINEREGYKLIDNKETGEQKAIEGGYCLSPGTRVIYPQDLTQFRNSLAMSPAPYPVKPEFLKLIVPAMAADSIKSSL
jgi:insulysin